MNDTPPFDDILGDDSLAPLKRNHACLQCKKRKVKCDATRPTCAPCMRSHAHALRTAQRNKTAPPPLICTYTEGDDSDHGDEDTSAQPLRHGSHSSLGPESRKRTLDGHKRPFKGPIGGRDLTREKDIRRDEDREALLARIAELESRLAGLTPTDSNSTNSLPNSRPLFSSSNYASTAWMQSDQSPQQNINNTNLNTWSQPQSYNLGGEASGSTDVNLTSSNIDTSLSLSAPLDSDPTFDYSTFMMLPAYWPPALPPPFLLDHLVETFFNQVPLMPRIIHKASLLTRLRLPPNAPGFPHPALLHAICAEAAPYTAWVNSIPPEHLEAAIEKHKSLHGSLDNIEDFGLAQAEAGQRAIKFHTASCMFDGGQAIVDITQASLIMSDIYASKGLLPISWLVSGNAARFVKALELLNKNKPKRYKEALAPDPADDFQREERLALVWMAFLMDSGMCMNAFWSGSFDLNEVRCQLPAGFEQFKGKHNSVPENPQSAHSADVLTRHPVADSFVLVSKAATLVARVSSWIREWHQRDIVDGDEFDGMQYPSFQRLIDDIHKYQSSVPTAIRSIFKQLEGSHDPSLLLIHIVPNVALILLYEPFVDWHAPSSHSLTQMQRGYESVLSVLHLIPSNLDVTLVMTFTSLFSLYTVGRIIANFVHRSNALGQYAIGLKCQAELSVIQNLFTRYGQKHNIGLLMVKYLDAYLALDPMAAEKIDHCIEMSRPAQFRTASMFVPEEPPSDKLPSGPATTGSGQSSDPSPASGLSPAMYTPPNGSVGVGVPLNIMGALGVAPRNDVNDGGMNHPVGIDPTPPPRKDMNGTLFDFGPSGMNNPFFDASSLPAAADRPFTDESLDSMFCANPEQHNAQNPFDPTSQDDVLSFFHADAAQLNGTPTQSEPTHTLPATQAQNRFAVGPQMRTVQEWSEDMSGMPVYASDSSKIIWSA